MPKLYPELFGSEHLRFRAVAIEDADILYNAANRPKDIRSLAEMELFIASRQALQSLLPEAIFMLISDAQTGLSIGYVYIVGDVDDGYTCRYQLETPSYEPELLDTVRWVLNQTEPSYPLHLVRR